MPSQFGGGRLFELSAKFYHMGFFGPCDAMPDQKTMRTKCLASKRSNLAKIVIFGHFGPGLAGSFGALLVGWLVVVARGLYLARHIFTLMKSMRSARFFGILNQVQIRIFSGQVIRCFNELILLRDLKDRDGGLRRRLEVCPDQRW